MKYWWAWYLFKGCHQYSRWKVAIFFITLNFLMVSGQNYEFNRNYLYLSPMGTSLVNNISRTIYSKCFFSCYFVLIIFTGMQVSVCWSKKKMWVYILHAFKSCTFLVTYLFIINLWHFTESIGHDGLEI